MLRYVLAAQALRVFSATSQTRRLYRWIGNRRGAAQRSRGLPAHYLARADGNLRQLEAAGAIRDGMCVMEIGTGWAHWEALFVRCFYQVQTTLVDVWDNRQFAGFKAYAAELARRLPELDRPADQTVHAAEVLAAVARCGSFSEAYDALDFRFYASPDEAYAAHAGGSVDVIFSSDVFEHLPAAAVPAIMAEHHRLLKPGGTSSHQIVPADHLCIYDRAVHPKNYMRYSDGAWRLLFENDVQYVNRIQLSEWVRHFEKAGFDVAYTVVGTADVSVLQMAERFRALDPADAAVTVFRILGRKPVAPLPSREPVHAPAQMLAGDVEPARP